MQSHFSQIKYQLISHLKSQAFINKTAPIVVNGYKEIGTEIDLSAKEISVEDYSSDNFIVTTMNKKDFIVIYFESGDQSFRCAALCKETDIFNTVVNKVFEKKPSFRRNVNYFLCAGKKINDYQSIKDNKIKDGDHIIMVCNDD